MIPSTRGRTVGLIGTLHLAVTVIVNFTETNKAVETADRAMFFAALFPFSSSGLRDTLIDLRESSGA